MCVQLFSNNDVIAEGSWWLHKGHASGSPCSQLVPYTGCIGHFAHKDRLPGVTGSVMFTENPTRKHSSGHPETCATCWDKQETHRTVLLPWRCSSQMQRVSEYSVNLTDVLPHSSFKFVCLTRNGTLKENLIMHKGPCKTLKQPAETTAVTWLHTQPHATAPGHGIQKSRGVKAKLHIQARDDITQSLEAESLFYSLAVEGI